MSPAFVQRHGSPGEPPVVLLHPIATQSAVWAEQLPLLKRSHEVITIDLPGHGAAPPASEGLDFMGYARHVLGALDALGIERFALVGLSLGGMVAQAVALHSPERVRALVLAHTGCRTAPPVAQIWESRLQSLAAEGMAGQVAPTLARWFTPGFLASSPLTTSWVGDMIRNTSVAGYVAAVRAIQRLDHLERLAELPMPALVIAGEHDTAIPLEVATDLARRLPQGRLVTLPTAHLGNVEQPVAFTEAVGGFLAGCTAP